MSLFWRVFGGTILSIVALSAVTLYNNLSGGISDLRSELAREREARMALAKKEDVDTRSKALFDRIHVVEGYKADIETVKERVATSGTAIDGLKKDTAGIDLLKERMAAVEVLKKDVAGVDLLKERLAAMAIDLKAARDEVQKLQQEVEKNKAADLERKTARDSQAIHLEETVKELQRGLQDCREKLARFEGAQPTGPLPAPKSGRSVPAKSDPSEANGSKKTTPAAATKPVPVKEPDDE
jgi:DNA repair exonuclease SbcCD ATPase subunit